MKQLDPKSVWVFFLQFVGGGVFFILFLTPVSLVGVLSSVQSATDTQWPSIILRIAIWAYACALVLGLILSRVFAKLAYANYKYEMTELGFKKEYGVIWKKYVTIPYDRIQNVNISRGVLARILGLSDLQIQTAGDSAMTRRTSEGELPALSKSEAELIRDELIRRSYSARTSSGGL